MNLKKKKLLAKEVLKVGKERIIFVQNRLEEIKEAITKQDIRDLYKEGAIILKEIKGRRKNKRKKKRRTEGKIKKKIKKRKQEYVKITRKLRAYVSEMKKQKKLNAEEAKDIRNKIRNRKFKNQKNLKEHIRNLRK
jgi:large subunit ribosomal protein L19e